MPTLKIADWQLGYEDYGSGPLALLIHGSPGSAKTWAAVGKTLAITHRVIAPDLPGYGETTPQDATQEPSVEYAVRLLEELVAIVGTPAVLAGHSYGGVVALAAAMSGKIRRSGSFCWNRLLWGHCSSVKSAGYTIRRRRYCQLHERI